MTTFAKIDICSHRGRWDRCSATLRYGSLQSALVYNDPLRYFFREILWYLPWTFPLCLSL